MRRALFIPADSEVDSPRAVEVGDYHDMARKIGCTGIERVRVDEDKALVVDGEFRYTTKPINEVASRLYGFGIRHGDPIMGDCLLMFEGFVDDGVDFLDSDTDALSAWVAEKMGEQAPEGTGFSDGVPILALGNDDPLPDDLPEELKEFFRELRASMGWCDHGKQFGQCEEGCTA